MRGLIAALALLGTPAVGQSSPAELVEACGGYRMELAADGLDAEETVLLAGVLRERLRAGQDGFLSGLMALQLDAVEIVGDGVIVVHRAGRGSLGLETEALVARGAALELYDVLRQQPTDEVGAGERAFVDPGGADYGFLITPDRPVVADLGIARAEATIDAYGARALGIELTDDGRQVFAEVTGERVGETLAIVIGDEMMTAPRIMDRISGGSLVITGLFSQQETDDLADALNRGALRHDLRVVSEMTIAPQDGASERCAGVPVQE